jgi:hypothetical protein
MIQWEFNNVGRRMFPIAVSEADIAMRQLEK